MTRSQQTGCCTTHPLGEVGERDGLPDCHMCCTAKQCLENTHARVICRRCLMHKHNSCSCFVTMLLRYLLLLLHRPRTAAFSAARLHRRTLYQQFTPCALQPSDGPVRVSDKHNPATSQLCGTLPNGCCVLAKYARQCTCLDQRQHSTCTSGDALASPRHRHLCKPQATHSQYKMSCAHSLHGTGRTAKKARCFTGWVCHTLSADQPTPSLPLIRHN